MSSTLIPVSPGGHHEVSTAVHRVQLTDAVRLTGLSPTTIRRYVERGKHGFSVDKSEVPHTYIIPKDSVGRSGAPVVSSGDHPGAWLETSRYAPSNRSETPRTDADREAQGLMSVVDTIGLQVGTHLETLRNEVIIDLNKQLDRHEDDKVHLRAQLTDREQELRDAVVVHRDATEALKTDYEARVAALQETVVARESDIVARDSRVTDLTEQVSALEAKVREVLEDGKADSHQLANRIADLVQQHADIHTRVLELEPVAAEVPMLQAAVEDSKAELTDREQILFQRERQLADINEDIETIASRPVAGPVFRLLTKGKLRI